MSKRNRINQRREISDSLARLRVELISARSCFNCVNEPELVDASIHRINSLMSQYSWYFRRAREIYDGDGRSCSNQ